METQKTIRKEKSLWERKKGESEEVIVTPSGETLLMALRQNGILLSGHFLLSSGLHSSLYFEKFRILERPDLLGRLVDLLIDKLRLSLDLAQLDKVVGPTVGGAIVAFEAARQLGKPVAFSEKIDKDQVIRRGEGVREGEEVLVVDDVLTTGNSIRKAIRAATVKGAKVKAVGVIIDRSVAQPKDFSYECVLRYPIKTFTTEECPLCKKCMPIVKLGS